MLCSGQTVTVELGTHKVCTEYEAGFAVEDCSLCWSCIIDGSNPVSCTYDPRPGAPSRPPMSFCGFTIKVLE